MPYENNASKRGVRKIKIKQKVSGCFRTDSGADDFAKLHSIAETAMKNGNSKFNAI
ncbi:MAG: IS66 family transposase, partial [Segatella copri]|nr:IS66 family transposase [Segatella copri]